MLVHGTCIEIDGHGILLRGPSGSGKSDLALRLIDGGARLVADDQVALSVDSGTPWAKAPAAIAGRMEVRGLGILDVEAVDAAVPVALVIELVAPGDVPRLPDRAEREIDGVRVPAIMLAPFEASAPAKVRLAVRAESRNSTAGRTDAMTSMRNR